MKKIVIYGDLFPDFIKLIDAINRHTPTWEIVGYLNDNKGYHGEIRMGYPILGGREIIPKLVEDEDIYFISNVSGNLKKAKSIANLLDSYGCKIPNLIHPSIDLNYVEVGRGCIIPEGCIIGGNAKFGDFVTLRLGVLVSHDVVLEDFAFCGPRTVIGSNAHLKKGCFIGAGATIMLDRTIGENSIVGAGSVVTKDVLPNTKVAGVPAKIME